MYIVRNMRGLGQDATDSFSINIPQMTLAVPTLPPAYSDTSTFTGLPLIWEIGLGLLGTVLLFRFTQTATRRVSAGVRAARSK